MKDLKITVLPREESGDFRKILQDHDIRYSEKMFTNDAPGAGVTLFGEFFIAAKTIGPPVIAAIGGWYAARQGRTLRIKTEKFEVEASSMKEFKELLELADKRSTENESGQE